MSGAFILAALQVVAMGNFNHSNSPRHEVYGWQPIGTFSTAEACVKASQELAKASHQVALDTDEKKTNGVRAFRCLPVGAPTFTAADAERIRAASAAAAR